MKTPGGSRLEVPAVPLKLPAVPVFMEAPAAPPTKAVLLDQRRPISQAAVVAGATLVVAGVDKTLPQRTAHLQLGVGGLLTWAPASATRLQLTAHLWGMAQ